MITITTIDHFFTPYIYYPYPCLLFSPSGSIVYRIHIEEHVYLFVFSK